MTSPGFRFFQGQILYELQLLFSICYALQLTVKPNEAQCESLTATYLIVVGNISAVKTYTKVNATTAELFARNMDMKIFPAK